jgi:mRNA interferase HicA
MKRSKLIQHLTKNGCVLLREGGRHSIWKNANNGEMTAVPHHSEIRILWHKKFVKTSKSSCHKKPINRFNRPCNLLRQNGD